MKGSEIKVIQYKIRKYTHALLTSDEHQSFFQTTTGGNMMTIERNFNNQSTITPNCKLQFTLHDKNEIADNPFSCSNEKGDEVA